MNVTGIGGDNLKHLQFDGQRCYVTQDGVTHFATLQAAGGRLAAARDKAKHDALKNLARYKFSNFGYHAARWVTLNRIIGDKQDNPFKFLVQAAKASI